MPTINDRIVIGVWYQSGDLTTLQKWVDRGVDTIIGPPTINGVWDVAAFCANVYAKGLKTWVLASDATASHNAFESMFDQYPYYPNFPDPTSDPTYDGFEAWLIEPDEPDLEPNLWPNGSSPWDTATSVNKWVQRCEFLKSISPTTPIIGNWVGSNLSYVRANGATGSGLVGQDFINWMAPVDYVGCDYYPITINGDAATIPYLAPVIEALSYYSGGTKPLLSFVECSDQNLNGLSRVPTVDEFRAMVWLNLILGCTAICYFPQSVGSPVSDDATPTEISDEMPILTAEIRSHEARLLMPTVLVPLSSPFYASDRYYDDGGGEVRWRYQLNVSDVSADYGPTSYAAYELKVFEVEQGTGSYVSAVVTGTGINNGCRATLTFDVATPGVWNPLTVSEVGTVPVLTVVDSHPDGGTVTRYLSLRYVSATINGSDQLVVVCDVRPYGTSSTDDNWSYGACLHDDSTATITLTSGWLTDGDGNLSGSTTDSSVTNNSTLAYPVSIVRLVSFPNRRITGVDSIEVDADHLHGIESVTLTITPSSGGPFTLTQTDRQWVTDSNSRTTVKGASLYQFDVDASDYANGAATIAVSAKPKVGTETEITSVSYPYFFDSGNTQPSRYVYVNPNSTVTTTSATGTPAWDTLLTGGTSSATARYVSASGATWTIAVVSGTFTAGETVTWSGNSVTFSTTTSAIGNDGTAVSYSSEGAALAATPFATMQAAIKEGQNYNNSNNSRNNADGVICCLAESPEHTYGVYNFFYFLTTTNYPPVIRSATGADPTKVVIRQDGTATDGIRTTLVEIQNLTVHPRTAVTLLANVGGAGSPKLFLSEVDFTGVGRATNYTPAPQGGYGWSEQWLRNCSISTARSGFPGKDLVRGCSVDTIGQHAFGGSLAVVDCDVNDLDPTGLGLNGIVYDFPDADNIIINNLNVQSLDATALGFYIEGSTVSNVAIRNVAIVGGYGFYVDDGTSSVTFDHLQMENITLTGSFVGDSYIGISSTIRLTSVRGLYSSSYDNAAQEIATAAFSWCHFLSTDSPGYAAQTGGTEEDLFGNNYVPRQEAALSNVVPLGARHLKYDLLGEQYAAMGAIGAFEAEPFTEGVLAGGSAIVSPVGITVSGGATSGGTATLLKVSNVAGSGGALAGGTASVYGTSNVTVSGGAVAGSAATVSRISSVTVSGGAVAGGAASVSKVPSITVSGGAVSGGTASVLKTTNITVSGGALGSGSESVATTLLHSVTGGALAGGAVSVSKIPSITVSGGALGNGSESVTVTLLHSVTGGTVSGGTGIVVTRLSVSFNGGGQVGGQGAIEGRGDVFIPSAGASFSGQATIQGIFAKSTSGGQSISGQSLFGIIITSIESAAGAKAAGIAEALYFSGAIEGGVTLQGHARIRFVQAVEPIDTQRSFRCQTDTRTQAQWRRMASPGGGTAFVAATTVCSSKTYVQSISQQGRSQYPILQKGSLSNAKSHQHRSWWLSERT